MLIVNAWPRAARVALFAATFSLLLAGCGLQVASPDLFVLTRTDPGHRLSLLVNDGGTIRCNGGQPRPLSDQLLVDARQLAADLGKDADAKLSLVSPPDAVYRYVVKLQNGTIAFPDTAGRGHPELARAQLFAVQAAQSGTWNVGTVTTVTTVSAVTSITNALPAGTNLLGKVSSGLDTSVILKWLQSSSCCLASTPKSTVAAIP